MNTLNKISSILDKLIYNEDILSSLNNQNNFNIEIDALKKTQDSIKSHLFFLAELYKNKKIRNSQKFNLAKKEIIKKTYHYNKISQSTIQIFTNLSMQSKTQIRKNRAMSLK